MKQRILVPKLVIQSFQLDTPQGAAPDRIQRRLSLLLVTLPAADELGRSAIARGVMKTIHGLFAYTFVKLAVMDNLKEQFACTPHPLHPQGFNPMAQLPYDLTSDNIRLAMQVF